MENLIRDLDSLGIINEISPFIVKSNIMDFRLFEEEYKACQKWNDCHKSKIVGVELNKRFPLVVNCDSLVTIWGSILFSNGEYLDIIPPDYMSRSYTLKLKNLRNSEIRSHSIQIFENNFPYEQKEVMGKIFGYIKFMPIY